MSPSTHDIIARALIALIFALFTLPLLGCATLAPAAPTFTITDTVDHEFTIPVVELPAMVDRVPSVAELLEVEPVNPSETPNSSDHIPDVSTMVETAPPQQVEEVANTSRPVGGCSCGPDCDCGQGDACLCWYKPQQINGEWYCERDGVRLKYTAVRCYGPDVPCDYEWLPAPVSTPRAYAAPSQPACVNGNCGTSPGRTIRGRGFFGRR